MLLRVLKSINYISVAELRLVYMANKKTTKKSIIFIAMLVLFAGVMTMCSRPDVYPDEPDNGRDRTVLLTDSNGTNQPSYR